MLTYISIIITAIFINNIVLAQFLGICPFLGVSKNSESALGMGAAVTFVMAVATLVTWCLQIYLLDPLDLQFLQTILFILVIAALVQMLEIIIRKIAPALYLALGVYLPLITTNCAVLGVAILVIQKTSHWAKAWLTPSPPPSVSPWPCGFSPAYANSWPSPQCPNP